jgi:hypothetical protein
VDRRHGKRPLPSEASEEKEKEHDFPDYASSWSETDVSAMVTALSKVIGKIDDNPTPVQSTPLTIPESTAVKEEPDSTQPVQDQGIENGSSGLTLSSFYFWYFFLGLFIFKLVAGALDVTL